MQKLIIIRCHSGSGKSTFAHKKITEFQQQFPKSTIFHIENDQYLYENGKYIWTEQRFFIAKRKSAEKLLKIANSLNMQIEIYRMMNFFENQHNVSNEKVRSMFEALERNPIPNERCNGQKCGIFVHFSSMWTKLWDSFIFYISRYFFYLKNP